MTNLAAITDGANQTGRDPRADSRFARGRAAFAESAFEEARDLFEQALDLAPDWIGAHLALADAAAACGDPARAKLALHRALELDAADRHGAGLALARLDGTKQPDRAPTAYVAALFDDYAPRFETHLTRDLFYTGPADLSSALRAAGFERAERALDLGCGTGLCGSALRGSVDWLAGVDLSPRMVALSAAKTAAGRALYDRLAVGDATNSLEVEPVGSLDLVTAADVLIYVGDLAPVFAGAARALPSCGLLAFTVQSHAGLAPFIVGADLRFAHAPDAVVNWLDAAGFDIAHWSSKSARRENGREVPGLVVVGRRR